MKLLLPLLLSSLLLAASCNKASDAPAPPENNSKITKGHPAVQNDDPTVMQKHRKPYYEAAPKD